MSDETTVQLGHQELQDHNELVEYIRKLLEKIKLLTDLYDQNLTALTEHNESESSHPDLRILLAEGNDELQNQLDSFKDDITKKTDATDKRITDGLNDFDLRLRNAVEVNNVQNDRLTALEADVALKIYDKDVSAVGHTGQFDDILNRPNITISDATNEHTGNSIRITGGNTKLVLPSTITADLKGNITGNLTGNANTATKLATAKKINGTNFDGTANITTAYWGTARNISITDGTNTSTAVSVNGSQAYSLNLPSTIKATFVGNITGNVTGNATSATKLQTARSLWGNNFDGSQNLSGNIHFTNDDLTGVVVGAIGKVGNNDFWRVGGGATANDSGFMELATADNGNEPIYVRQYTGEYATITRTATLLDASGNTRFPGTVTATAFYGNITGNVTGNCSGSSGSCTGNAATATRANSAAKADTATNATNATNSNAANQLQAFVNDNFTSGNHYVKAIRSPYGWSTHLWMCYNNGAKMADEVSVNYANSAGSANTANSATTATYASRSANNGGFYINNYLITIG